MKNKEFLAKLSSLLDQGEIASEKVLGLHGGTVGTIPRIFGTIDGYLVKFDFVSLKEVKLEVNTKPEHYLYLCHYNKFTGFMRKLNLAGNVKIYNENFNQKYFLRNTNKASAERTLSMDNIEIINTLEPFDYFEQSFKEYRMLKDIGKDYSPEKAFEELTALVQFVKNCDAEWGTTRKLV